MSTPARFRRGFTLVELLVVITIIGILMSLLIPVASSARERARQVQCTSNMSNVGKAILSYESSHRVYPLNWGVGDETGADPKNTIGHSWISMILPQLDQMPLFNRISWGQPLSTGQAADSNAMLALPKSNYLAATNYTLPILTCPSDFNNGTSQEQVFLLGSFTSGIPVTCYKGCMGHFANTTTVTRGSVKYSRWDYCNGIFCRNFAANPAQAFSVTHSPDDVTDGQSNTIMVGETVTNLCGYAAWYWWNGSVATANTALNANVMPTSPPVAGTTKQASYYSSYFGYMSKHPNGGLFCLADGSVKWISTGIDLYIYRSLSTINGSSSASASGYANVSSGKAVSMLEPPIDWSKL